ncbi:LysE/ArgO family amino acid transporter [Nocardia camponoti]|uniref:LysE/ArgO family amino acid transporter n=1 Tax=Nocardia camponoti TaxID=1616106 RepID=UPI001666BA9A|nr:LysE/ArgO family amino acid transporter [Nocardia camponoti]
MPSSLAAALTGFGFGLSLIVAIGAQNAFVLRQGIRGEHVLPVVAICAGSDIALIAAGVGGFGAVIEAAPMLVTVVRYAGAAFLFGYAVLAARRAFRSSALIADTAGASTALGATMLTCLALTWLNPHVYLDTVVLLGGYANAHAHKWMIALGAMIASVVWFAGIGFGARRLAPLFQRPVAWRVLDGAIAVVMAALALSLVLG